MSETEDRPDERDEDREEPDVIDRTVLFARKFAFEALMVLVDCIHDQQAATPDKLKAAQHILEVAGCLSL